MSRFVAAELRGEIARVGTTQRQVAIRMKVEQAWMSRRLSPMASGAVNLTFEEAEEICRLIGVDFEALIVRALRACRDSNPKPSVWEPRIIQGGKRVKSGLTAFEPCGTYGPTHRRDMGRTLSERLRAVQ